MLRLNNVEVLYDDVVLVLKGLSLEVREGQIVALLGTNGAGKSTTLKAISGLLASERGAVRDGTITFTGPAAAGTTAIGTTVTGPTASGGAKDVGEEIHTLPAETIVCRGIFQVMEGRRVFEHLTVEENLLAGAHTRRDRDRIDTDLQRVYTYFPRLDERRRQWAGFLSGGEQQMLAIGRALMARPRLMLLDEPSLGLAPLLVQEIFRVVERINRDEGTTILLVEQNARLALGIADYGYVMEGGRVVLDGPPEVLAENADVREFYLGSGEGGERKSYRHVKHYKRRKRWLS